jgi:hypothetical protein
MKATLSREMSKSFAFQWMLVFVVCILTRLPYLLGKHCSFDGDEAIIGIMAQDLLSGKNIPVYFYGQQYGFSFFEVITTAIGILLFGSNVWALKFGALLIFSVGTTFLFRLFLKKEVRFLWALVAIIILSLFPAWIIWAAKCRGGYVTAYSLACIILYLVETKQVHIKWIIVTSLLMALAVHAQIFIAAAVSFLLLGWILKAKKFNYFLMAACSFAGFYALFKLPAFLNENYWQMPFSFHYHYNQVIPFVKQVPKVALGYYYYEMTFYPPASSKWLGVGYYLLAVLLTGLIFLKGNKTMKTTLFLLLLGGVCSFVSWERLPPVCLY